VNAGPQTSFPGAQALPLPAGQSVWSFGLETFRDASSVYPKVGAGVAGAKESGAKSAESTIRSRGVDVASIGAAETRAAGDEIE